MIDVPIIARANGRWIFCSQTKPIAATPLIAVPRIDSWMYFSPIRGPLRLPSLVVASPLLAIRITGSRGSLMSPPDFPVGVHLPEPHPTPARRGELIAEIE